MMVVTIHGFFKEGVFSLHLKARYEGLLLLLNKKTRSPYALDIILCIDMPDPIWETQLLGMSHDAHVAWS